MDIDWSGLHGRHFAGCAALVTGGAGFIGSHLAEALARLGARVAVIDDLSGGEAANVEAARAGGGRVEFSEGSILDETLLRRAAAGCRYVFHEAALGSVPRSVEQPELYTEVNVLGTVRVLEAARAAGAERVVFAASSSAYGDSLVLPKVESMLPQPKSPYAATKVAGEMLLRAYSDSYGLDTASLRYFNIFGPRQNANSAYAAVIAAFAKALLAGERPVIFGDGGQSRDFTYVANAVHANLLPARSPRPLGGQVLNVACGQRVTVTELAAVMARMLERPDLAPAHREERAGDVRDSLADLSLAESVLGYRPIVGFEEGLAPTLAWYREALAGRGRGTFFPSPTGRGCQSRAPGGSDFDG